MFRGRIREFHLSPQEGLLNVVVHAHHTPRGSTGAPPKPPGGGSACGSPRPSRVSWPHRDLQGRPQEGSFANGSPR
eukprot:8125602-Pyramimonas_sp.AAC.1